MIGGSAFASGYQSREQSAVARGVSQAGSAARGHDPSMLFSDPASQTWLRGSRSSRCCRASCPPAETPGANATRNPLVGGGPITGSLGGDAGVDALVPGFHASTGLVPGWRLGIGVTSPWGLVTKYPADCVGRYHAPSSSLRTINVTPALSWQATPTLALGVSLQIQHASARLSSANDCGAVGAHNPQLFAAGSRPGRCDGRSTISGDETGLGWQLGAQWEARPGTPRSSDSDRCRFSVGATWQALPALTLADTHVRADDARLALSDRGGPGTADLPRGNLDASTRASVTIVAVQARTTFRRAPTGRS